MKTNGVSLLIAQYTELYHDRILCALFFKHPIKKRNVLIFPLAFSIDNSETDYELEIEYREIAQELGFENYKVCRCPNDSESFVDALEEIYKKMK